MFYSNFVPNAHRFLRYSTCKDTVTLKPGLGSLKVIVADTDRSAAYNFLLTFHSNHGPISHRCRDKRRFLSKIANFSLSVYFAPRWRGFPRSWDPRWGRKTRMMVLTGLTKSLTISSAVWIQSTNVTDGQKDRRTDTGRQQRPRLRIASSGNKNDIQIRIALCGVYTAESLLTGLSLYLSLCLWVV